MLSNIIESDTKALAKVFSNKEFYRPVDGNKKDYKTYLADIVSGDHVIELNKVESSFTKRNNT
ncbi:hypothetical protein [Wolbachia endosymbiont of Armadillidium arcangelii]|uniref:Uncharacterized protein n=1 Tax=Wolbachia endosymbiont of Armadillidium arcangelii TaxID=3158571 RepID=A0AAU7Q3I3_9RICK